MKIETKDYFYECGDGCCTQYGTMLYIDGKLLEGREFFSSGDAYQYVLEEMLGHQVDYIYEDEE
jgi:hypothetical protein